MLHLCCTKRALRKNIESQLIRLRISLGINSVVVIIRFFMNRASNFQKSGQQISAE